MAQPEFKHKIPKFPADAFGYLPVASLKANPLNPRTHSNKQTQEIAKSIEIFGFTMPLLVDENGVVLAGHGRLGGAKLLGLSHVPAIRIEYLSDTQKRAYMIADNKLAEKAGWDREMLAVELSALAVLLPEIDLDITLTGFEVGEIDLILGPHQGSFQIGQRRVERRFFQGLIELGKLHIFFIGLDSHFELSDSRFRGFDRGVRR